MLLEVIMNTFKKWSADVVEILKAFYTNRHITESRGKNVWKKEYTAEFKFLLLENDKHFPPVSHSVILLCLVSTQNI